MQSYYNVEQIAELLALHPKTIQRYIREGKLPAGKIGKAWRVSGHDLSIFLEQSGIGTNQETADDITDISCGITVSSVIDIPMIKKTEVPYLTNTLTALLHSKPETGKHTTFSAQYNENEHHLRIMFWSDLDTSIIITENIRLLTEQLHHKDAGVFT